MDKEIFDLGKELDKKITDLLSRKKNLEYAIDRGGCGIKATITYTPGYCNSKREVHILDKDIIKKALKKELHLVEYRLSDLQQKFDNL
jgi:hypothetical protein